jgi:hypothetical protein
MDIIDGPGPVSHGHEKSETEVFGALDQFTPLVQFTPRNGISANARVLSDYLDGFTFLEIVLWAE